MALLVWAGITASYLHPTVAGVLVASVIPVRGAVGERPMGPMLEYLHPTVAFLRERRLHPKIDDVGSDGECSEVDLP
jgi:hypothetical protein